MLHLGFSLKASRIALCILAFSLPTSLSCSRSTARKEEPSLEEKKKRLADEMQRLSQERSKRREAQHEQEKAQLENQLQLETSKASNLNSTRLESGFKWLEFDQPKTLGGAATLLATDRGVIATAKQGELIFLPWQPPSPRAPMGKTQIATLPDNLKRMPLSFPAAFSNNTAIWLQGEHLLASPFGQNQKGKILSKNALPGSRVAIALDRDSATHPHPSTLPAHLYIARASSSQSYPKAMFAVDDSKAVIVSEEGSSVHDVALIHDSIGYLALMLDAGTAMSTLHARRIQLSENAKPKLGEDEVIWIGGGSSSTTRLVAGPRQGGGAWVWIAQERGARSFGLHRIEVEAIATGDSKSHWLEYENGLSPAPVAFATICDRDTLFIARPISSEPKSEQELVMLPLTQDGYGEAQLIATGIFFDISVAATGRTGLIAYSVDRKSVAISFRCR